MRPKSVVLAERLYLAAIILLGVLPLLGLRNSAGVPVRVLVASLGLTVFFMGLLLFLVVLAARRRSRAALWSLVALTALNVAGYLVQVSTGAVATGWFGVLTTVQVALTVVSVVLLFRPNARAWFEAPDGDDAAELHP